MNDKSLLEVLHSSVKSMHDLDIVGGKTMRNFDKACLPPIESLTPNEIKFIRLESKISQSVFAKLMNASSSTIKKWETGEKEPRGISLKLLNIIKHRGIDILYM
jgi:putative transcriptional regulator